MAQRITENFIDLEVLPVELHGKNWQIFIDKRIVEVAQRLRNQFGNITINDVYIGGGYNLSGFRPFDTKIGAKYSQHKFGRALDLKFLDQIDFSGLDIEQEIRLKGNIGYNNEAEILVNEFETSAHNFEQNQDQVIFNYSFQTEPISFFNSNILLKDLIIGNKITVTSYNYFNHWVLTEAELKAATIEEVKDLPFNKCAIFKIKFAERKRNTIKRNYL